SLGFSYKLTLRLWITLRQTHAIYLKIKVRMTWLARFRQSIVHETRYCKNNRICQRRLCAHRFGALTRRSAAAEAVRWNNGLAMDLTMAQGSPRSELPRDHVRPLSRT